MTAKHLQLHGQLGSNVKEVSGQTRFVLRGGGGSENRLELQQSIAQKNDQGKELSRQRFQHTKLHTNFRTNLVWMVLEGFEQGRDLVMAFVFGNLKGSEIFAFVSSEIVEAQFPAAHNEPLNDLKVSFERGMPQWSAAIFIRQRDIDTRIFQQQLNNRHMATVTTK